MRRKILSIIFVFLLVSFPVVQGAEIVKEEDFDETNTGESIAINVKSYEPTILTSNLIEDNSVPVYIFLAGSTLGTLLGSSTNVEPVYGGIEIEKMFVKPLDIETSDYLEGEPKWYKPNKFDADTLGYVTVTLKQFDPDNFEICASDSECDEGFSCETGACIPKEINLNFTAEIWFKQAERLYSLSKSALILPIDSDENEWEEKLDTYGSMYSFYGGRGLVRVKDISGNGVDLTVYSNKDLYWPIIGAPRAIADIHLDKGETSDYIDLGFTDEQVLGDAKFRITLNNLKDAAQERAVVSVNVNGMKSQVIVTEGSTLYPGSTWTVKEISTNEGRTGIEYVVTIKDAKGNVEKVVSSQGGGLGETESEILNKKFSEKASGTETYYFTAGTKTINPTSVSNLDSVLEKWVTVDVSKVENDATLTNKVSIQEGVTLKEVLIALLPPGYHYSIADKNVIEIKKFSSEDPCLNAEIYSEEALEETLKELSEEEKLDNTLKLNILCTGISYFKQVVSDFNEETYVGTRISLEDFAYLRMGQSYEAIAASPLGESISSEQKKGAEEKALEAYKELVSKESVLLESESSVMESVNRLTNSLFGDFSYGSISIEDNGQFAYVELLSVQELVQEQQSSAVLSKDGIQNNYYVGQALFSEDFETGAKAYNWYVYSISEENVQIRKIFTSSSKISTVKTMEVDGSAEVIDGSSFQVKSTDTKKEAYLTITPGTGGSLKSSSNFTVHIPIESRAFDLNPAKIEDRIEKTKKLQEKLDKIVETLEKIVKTWNYVCLGVFAIVTLKSSFFSASAQARHDAIHGVDDSSGWNAYCEEKSSGDYSERKYKTYDDCMLENAEAIDSDIKSAQDANEYVENLNGDYSEELKDISNGYDDLSECEGLLGDSVFLSEDSKKDYVYLKQLTENGVSDEVRESAEKKLESYTGTNELGGETAYMDARQEGCNKVHDALEAQKGELSKYEGEELEHKRQEIALGIYETVYNEKLVSGGVKGVGEFDVKSLPSLDREYLGEDKIISVGRVFEGKTSKKFTLYKTSGEAEEVTILSFNDYHDILIGKIESENGKVEKNDDGKVIGLKVECDDNAEDNCAKFVKDLKKIDEMSDKTKQIVADNGAKFYMDTQENIYVGQAAYSSGSISSKYATGAKIEIYDSGEYKGLPYCLPHKGGNFIKFTDYTTNNEIETMQYWNVGSDGDLCTNDDILVAHESELHYDTASPSYRDLVTFANKWVKKTWYAKETQEIDDHIFTVNYGKSKTVQDGASASCFDVMDPSDCKLLFNTCDPVMCPPSRFNLGGRWQVDSVVESGIIGSVILPQGSGDVVPFCFTGILASLHFWKSMLDGYVECLEAAKYEGKSVGICDKIRSVYMCELVVREAAAIMDNNEDGLLDFLANKAYGQKDKGGGEYFKFKENVQNVQNSFSYFTTEYSTNAFAAFKGRSLEEVGTTICQQAIYAQTPWFGDLMDQVTTPEDPNQFYATLTVKPYAPSIGESAYQTYYHLYAGVNPNIENIVYSVYLKNSLTGEIFYTTDECKGTSSSLELGGMVDKTLDCLAPEGLDTVCVVMNGETNCGFGTVSTAFSYDYLKDAIVADEAKREIKTEKECYPSVSVASPKASSLASLGATDGLALPYSYGELSTGIQRVCALQDPGIGQGGKGDWAVVGSCGEDSSGRSLGYCWMNMDSFSIKDAEKNENVSKHLETRNFEILKASIENLIDAEKSAELYGQYMKIEKKNCMDYVSLAKSLRNLYDTTLSYEYAANALYQLGEVYYQIGSDAKVCGLTGRKQISYEAYIDDTDIGAKDVFYFGEDFDIGDGYFEITFKNLINGETVEVSIEPDSGIQPGCYKGVYGTVCSMELEFDSEDDVIDVTFTIGRALGGEDYTKSFRFKAGERELEDGAFEDASKECHDTCAGLTGVFCDVETCRSISKGCYFDGSWVNECFACEDLDDDKEYENDEDRCNELSDDEERCESSACYGEFLDRGKCIWKNDACEYKETDEYEPSSAEIGEFSANWLEDEEEFVSLMEKVNEGTFGNKRCSCGDNCEDYAEWIYHYAKINSVDPFLILAVMIQESNCLQTAGSNTDCVGLMQICKGTAEEVCREDLSDLRNDAEVNIECGSYILLKKYEANAQGGEFNCKGNNVEYSGWRAALRGYVGWGCVEGHEDYVEEVESIYEDLRKLYDAQKGVPAGVTNLVDKDNYLIIEDSYEAAIIEEAAEALDEVAQELYKGTGYALKVSSASRTLEGQATLFYDNCLVDGRYACNPATCDITGGDFKKYINGLDINNNNKDAIIENLADHGKAENCPHTSYVAVDVWCDDGGGDYKHDPICQYYLTKLMLSKDFCRLNSEAWHFEWDKNKVSKRSCSTELTSEYNGKDPLEGECGFWDYNNHECLNTCIDVQENKCGNVK